MQHRRFAAQQDAEEIGRERGFDPDPLRIPHAAKLVGSEIVEHVEAAAQQGCRRRGRIRDDRETQPIDQRAFAAGIAVGLARQRTITGEATQLDILIAAPFSPAERAGADRREPFAVGADRGAVGDAGAAAIDPRQGRQEHRRPAIERDLDGVRIDHAHRLDPGDPVLAEIGLAAPMAVGCEIAVERPFDVACGQRRAIVEADVAAQREAIGAAVGRYRPPAREHRRDRAVLARRHQPFDDVHQHRIGIAIALHAGIGGEDIRIDLGAQDRSLRSGRRPAHQEQPHSGDDRDQDQAGKGFTHRRYVAPGGRAPNALPPGDS